MRARHRRRRRRPVRALWVIFGLLLGLSAPVVADHVNEPSAALLGIEFRIGEYATGTPANCGDTVDFQNLRVEQVATVEGKPSEHWTTRFGWTGPRGVGTPYVRWPHQNIGPHGHANIGHANVPLPFPGEYQIRMVSTGDVSSNRIEVVCSIFKE
jgi:hypothetical protein